MWAETYRDIREKKEKGMNALIQTFIRQALIVLGTWLANKGVMESSYIEAFAGIGIGLVAFGWRYIELWLISRKTK